MLWTGFPRVYLVRHVLRGISRDLWRLGLCPLLYLPLLCTGRVGDCGVDLTLLHCILLEALVDRDMQDCEEVMVMMWEVVYF
jgi:hypothetical protein